MTDHARRKALKEFARENRPPAGVYRIVNQNDGRYLLGSTTNLKNVDAKLDFARTTKQFGLIDRRMRDAVIAQGVEAFRVEVVETMEIDAGATEKEIKDDLLLLESLWREKLDASLSY